jgi:hypothetical protein
VLDVSISSFGANMGTISTVNNQPLGYVAPTAVDSPTVVSNLGQTLAVAQAPKSWLTTAETSQAQRPNVKEFMDRSGAPFLDASELIYGVVGSNTDVRDWSAIMASDDPMSAARQATGQMYGRTDITPRTDAVYMGASDTVAKEGNFAVRLFKDENNKVLDQGLKLIDAQGLLLRDAGSNPETIARNAWLFGFDTQPLAKLAQAATTVSPDLGRAVQQASITAPAANTATAVPQHQAPVLTMVAENINLLGLTGLTSQTTAQTIAQTTAQTTAQTIAPAKVEPVVVAQKDDQATSPSLQQVLKEAAANAFSHLDSASYLTSLFKG